MSNTASEALCCRVVRRCQSRWADLNGLATGLRLFPCPVGHLYGGATHRRLVDPAWFRPISGLKDFTRCKDVPGEFLVFGILNHRRYECLFIAASHGDRRFWFLSEFASFQRITPHDLTRVVGRQLRAAVRRWVAGFNLVGVNGMTGSWFDPRSGKFQPDSELDPAPLK